ncbi:MAG: hypothetical protein AAFN18_11835 [Cyanobacteria bacterium J06554_6]
MTATTTIRWATLMYDAGKLYPSKNEGWPAQHGVTMNLGEGQQERVWFNGDPLLSLLKKGDQVMLEYRQGRWRLAKQQTPELLAALQSRQTQQQPPMQQPQFSQPTPQQSAPMATQADTPQSAEAAYEQSLRLAVSRYGRAIDAAKALLGRKLSLMPEQLQQPEVVAAVQATAATLFISAERSSK